MIIRNCSLVIKNMIGDNELEINYEVVKVYGAKKGHPVVEIITNNYESGFSSSEKTTIRVYIHPDEEIEIN